MIAPTRRQLAQFAVDQLSKGQSLNKVAKELAAVLVDTNRIKDIELLAKDVAWELESRGKLVNADITTATPLSDALRDELTKFIKQSVKVEQVTLQENVDKSVIGGVRIETAIHNWDKTISRELTDIREAF